MREHELLAFQAYLASLNRSPRTVATYRAVVLSFAEYVRAAGRAWPPERSDVETFLARRRRDGARRSAATRNQELAAVRVFVTFATRELGWDADVTAGVLFVREPPRDPTVLSSEELRRFFRAIATRARTARRSRDLALVALLSQCGLRVHEAVGLDVEQFDEASATLVGVRGKGGTIHDVPVNSETRALVGAWLRDRRAGTGERALFVSGRGTRLSVRAVEHSIARLRSGAGTGKRVTPHTFRHTAATLALTFGADLSTVGDLLRHADLNVTRRYLHLVDERRREAVRRLGVAIPPEALSGTSRMTESLSEPGAVTIDGTARDHPPPSLDDQHGLDDIPSVALPSKIEPSTGALSCCGVPLATRRRLRP